jgi:hypothetical protein
MDMSHTNTMSLKDQIGASYVQVRGLALAFGICGLLVIVGPTAQADPISLSVMTSLQSGTITAVHHETVSISGKEYGFDQEVQARDQEDNHLELSAIRPNLDVKFHVKKNESNKIDLIIVYMPQ